ADNPIPDAPLSNEPLDPDTGVGRLEVYTIFTGSTDFVNTDALEDIAEDTRGGMFSGTEADVVDALLDIITAPAGKLLVGRDGAKDKLKGGAGPDDIQGLGRADNLIGKGGKDILQG